MPVADAYAADALPPRFRHAMLAATLILFSAFLLR